jgi:hypothetical protein
MLNIGPSMGGGFGIIFTIVPILIVIVFLIVIVGILTNGVRYFKNVRSPRQNIFARVVIKRMEVRNHTSQQSNGNNGMHPVHSSRTYYYITLEFDNGNRKEYLDVKNLYGLVVEGDRGYAAIQGDWIVAFERE